MQNNNKIKILVLSFMFPKRNNPSNGIFVLRQLQALSKYCEIKVISPVPWVPYFLSFIKKWQKYKELPFKDVIEGIEVYYPRYVSFPKKILFFLSGYLYYLGIAGLVDKICKNYKFDLIHSHVALPDGMAAISLAKKYKIPVVVSVHGTDVSATAHKDIWSNILIKRVFNKASRVIANSSKTAERIKTRCDKPDNVIVVNNGINLFNIYKGVSAKKNDYGCNTIILSVSDLTKTKGIHFVLYALARIIKKNRDISYIIVGWGQEEKNLVRLIDKLGLKQFVTMIKQELPQSKVFEYLSICDVFVLPSYSEGFGLVYLEAMAHGKPVIGCRGEGVEDIIEDDKTGILVTPQNVEAVESALIRLISDENLRRKMGDAGRKAAARFDWEETALKMQRIYNDLTGRE